MRPVSYQKKVGDGGPAPRRTGRQTIGRSITWHWTSVIALQITDPFSRQRGPLTPSILKLSKSDQREKGKNWSRVPDVCLTPRWTDWLPVGRNVTLTLTFGSSRNSLVLGGTICCIFIPAFRYFLVNSSERALKFQGTKRSRTTSSIWL
jgi:hypothetical protein